MRDKGSAVGWGADDRLVFGPSAVRDDRDCIAGVIDQLDVLTAVGQPVADAPVVSIDGDGESRRVAATEEDDVGTGCNDSVGREAEMGVRRRAVAQAPAAYIDGR